MNPHRKIGDVILKAENISLSFGGVKALTNISLDVREHEICAIIGPNGAGKSSMLNVINGVYHPQEGRVSYKGHVRDSMHATKPPVTALPALFRTSPCSRHERAGQHHDRAQPQDAHQLPPAGAVLGRHPARGNPPPPQGGRNHRLSANREHPQNPGRPPALWPAKRVELGRAGRRTHLAAAGRADGRHERRRKTDMCRFILDVNDEFAPPSC